MSDTFADQRARMLLNAKNYWMDRCAKAEADRDLTTSALKNLLECFPDKCYCHESYREREKNLGYSFKDPDCLYCDNEEEIKAARVALAAVMEDKCQTLVS